MAFKIAPLGTTFTLISILGFFISVFWVPQYSKTWAFSFTLVFVMMFIASVISMTYGPSDQILKLSPEIKVK